MSAPARARRACATALAVVAVLADTDIARAAEIGRVPFPVLGVEDENEDERAAIVVEGRGFYKPSVTALWMPRGVIVAVEELGRAVDEARATLPPESAGALPETESVPEQIVLSTHSVRLASTVRIGEHIDVNGAWQGAFVAASSPLVVTGSGGLFGASSSAPDRRLVDVDALLYADERFAVQHNIDQVNVALHTSWLTLVIGRQVISWGAGRLWNPTDLFSPFAPTDVDREVRRGADAVRASIPLGDTSEIDVMWLPQLDPVENGAVLRARTNVNNVDFSVTGAKYVDDLVLGGDATGDAGPLGWHAEAAWTWPLGAARDPDDALALDLSALDVDDAFWRGVLGVSARPTEIWTVVVEYYLNGFGALHPDDYVEKQRDPRVARGEVFGAGRNYLGIVSAWMLGDLTTVSLTAIANVMDPSAMVVAVLEHSLAQRVLVRVGANAPIGLGVDVSRFRVLDGDDVLTNSDDWQRATKTFGARSELGLSPFSIFAHLGAYFG